MSFSDRVNINQALDRLKGGDAEQQAIAAAIEAERERLNYRLSTLEEDRLERDAEIERLTRNLDICKTSYEVLDERYWKSATEIERLKALLSEARDVIRDEVEDNYPWKDKYPMHMLRYKADMDIVRRITDALGERREGG